MSFNPSLLMGKAPTIEDIMKDIGVESPFDIEKTVLNKCASLYIFESQFEGGILDYGTQYKFINCESTQFYRTLVEMGYGNMAMVISDKQYDEVYFLMFTDKVPERFRPIVASHEVYEYSRIILGIDQREAHLEAEVVELDTSDALNLKKEYLEFLQKTYPIKFNAMDERGLF